MDIKKLTKEELLQDIKEYLEKEIDLIERKELSSEAFSRNAWPYYQASGLGQKKALKKLYKRYYG